MKPVVATTKPVDTKSAPVVASSAPVDANKSISLDQWRALVAKMNGDKPRTPEEVNHWLAAHGYEQKPLTTARRWLVETH